jgi:hypothetical protein
MHKTLTAIAAAAIFAVASLSTPTDAQAGSGRVAAGVLGGLAAGMIIGGAIATAPPVYAAPVYVDEPVYVAPGPRCWREPRGPAYWNGYGWVQPSVRVCSR